MRGGGETSERPLFARVAHFLSWPPARSEHHGNINPGKIRRAEPGGPGWVPKVLGRPVLGKSFTLLEESSCRWGSGRLEARRFKRQKWIGNHVQRTHRAARLPPSPVGVGQTAEMRKMPAGPARGGPAARRFDLLGDRGPGREGAPSPACSAAAHAHGQRTSNEMRWPALWGTGASLLFRWSSEPGR